MQFLIPLTSAKLWQKESPLKKVNFGRNWNACKQPTVFNRAGEGPLETSCSLRFTRVFLEAYNRLSHGVYSKLLEISGYLPVAEQEYLKYCR